MSLLARAVTPSSHAGSYGSAARPTRSLAVGSAAVSVIKLLFLGLANLSYTGAVPILRRLPLPRPLAHIFDEVDPKPVDDPNLWLYLGVAVFLVLLGGVFAGLTIALMGQDGVYLEVLAASGDKSEKRNASRVLRLLKRGKHWVLVTLLLGNVITNETLPIVLDRSLGGGWPAVLSSTVLIVIFGEIAPQSVCVRYGLPIGATFGPLVLGLMWLLAPVAWPTAKLLDWILGEDHGQVYKKAGLKTLVTLHQSMGTASDRLNEDEVTIISGVLDLKNKPVGDIMTPMNDVFTMSADTVLDEKMMDTILSQGYSRIPIYAPDNPRNFIGMLLVKILITYDPEDALKVRDFALATLPETAPLTSCLDIVNFFQEGKSHMVLVSDFPGEPFGALGVVTLEDVIEELIGEEIIDESDVYVDVHKAIRRMAPAPKLRLPKGGVVTDSQPSEGVGKEGDTDTPDEQTSLLDKKGEPNAGSRKPSVTEGGPTVMLRRRSSNGAMPRERLVPVRSHTADMRQHLKHLGPSNVASRPKATKYSSVKIKPGVGTIPENRAATSSEVRSLSNSLPLVVPEDSVPAPEGGVGTGLLSSAGKDASDGVQAVAQGYGTMSAPTTRERSASHQEESTPTKMSAAEASRIAQEHQSPSPSAGGKPQQDSHDGTEERDEPRRPEKLVVDIGSSSRPVSRPRSSSETRNGNDDNSDNDDVPELESRATSTNKPKRTARSGSITESTIDVGGVTKVVLETNSSSDEIAQVDGAGDARASKTNGESAEEKRKKKKRNRGGKKVRSREAGSGKSSSSGSGESTPVPRKGD
ncbi:cell agglutination protein Mam3 [Elasticomyces elasticus]|nr:cell agglutination protein Mam3 [Elasticomyces elasticus]KAK5000672.1 cell agglutination protein Mam3 [Elasticomyces elasticus]